MVTKWGVGGYYVVSMLQYVDDIIFFGESNVRNVLTIKTILRMFELVSDLKVNFFKSSFGAFGGG